MIHRKVILYDIFSTNEEIGRDQPAISDAELLCAGMIHK